MKAGRLLAPLPAVALLLAWGGAWGQTAPPPEHRFEFEAGKMGAQFRVILYAPDEAAAVRAMDAASARMDALTLVLSDYVPTSELSRLSNTSGQGRAVPVSEDLWQVLALSQRMAERSEGAFDITQGPLINAWRRARRQHKLPTPGNLDEMRSRGGWRHLRLDAGRRTAELLAPKMWLDVGGMAKGYAVDEALKAISRQGITRAMASLGGDIAATDAPPGTGGWRVMITPLDAPGAPPARFVLLRHSAVSTSGDTHQRVEIDGVRYSHIVDPHTGLGLTDHSLVTVLAPDCTTTDLMETTISILGPERGLKLVEETPDTAVYIVRQPGDKIETWESPRWDALARTNAGG